MPDEFTKEEKEILTEAPADSPTRVSGDSERPTSPTGAAKDSDEDSAQQKG